jgi:hypothetical protein
MHPSDCNGMLYGADRHEKAPYSFDGRGTLIRGGPKSGGPSGACAGPGHSSTSWPGKGRSAFPMPGEEEDRRRGLTPRRLCARIAPCRRKRAGKISGASFRSDEC